MKSALEILKQAPFFESFPENDLQQLAEHAQWMSFDKGRVLAREGEFAKLFYVLVVGQVQLAFDLEESSTQSNGEGPPQVALRTVAEPGRVIGWSAFVEQYHYRANATATEDTQVLALDRDWVEGYAEEHPRFGVELMKRVLWVLGNRLRESRIRLVARRYDQEVMAIRALLDQSAAQLNVTSPLHKLPLYLGNRITLSDAFHMLELLQAHGDELERSLAGMSLEILANVRKELTIYQQLQTIYERVASAPHTDRPSDVRRHCCDEFIRLFDNVSHVIRGEENLPDQPGHIFVMNHLDNHVDDMLPNKFRLTLDTHFVSAMLLYRKYGEAPIRVIRKSDPDEYGHQKYYDRLGYIYVYAGHLDEDVEDSDALVEQRRRNFYDTARACLLDGKNIVICPEGACTTTERSPRPFKTGAFRLAAVVRPEPLIVPIAVANFDKKITRNTVVAVVHKPFRLSEFVSDPVDFERLFDFVRQYQQQFVGFVREAIELEQTASSASAVRRK